MSPQKPHYERVKILGTDIPLTQRGVALLSFVVVFGCALFVWNKLISQPETALLTLQEANDQLAESVEEYGLHVMEEPTKHELFEDADGGLALRVYSDHCVLIQRRTKDGVRTRLIPDLARVKRPGKVQQLDGPPPVLAGFGGTQSACQRGCLNPHPGQFRWWYGQRRGDWVEVWRQWQDGCQHFQLFHPQTNSWATNRDGSPAVQWTCCVH